MASIQWSSGVVFQFDESGLLVLCRVVSTDAAGVELQKQLRAANPTHTVVYIQGPAV